MKSKYKISVIIPAYNEEKTIGAVLQAIKQSKNVDEIICIDDGSTDNTLQQISHITEVKAISLPKNYGKSYAICRGLEQATGDIVVFIDADLIGFTDKNLALLLQPLLMGSSDVVIGYPARKLGKFFIPISGERAYYKKDLAMHLEEMKYKGFGLELYLNHLFRNKKTEIVPLIGVSHVLKNKKFSLGNTIKEYSHEIKDLYSIIFSTRKPASYFYYSYITLYHKKK